MKKGRHRRYEEARAMKRGPDLDIEALFTDLDNDPLSSITNGNGASADLEQVDDVEDASDEAVSGSDDYDDDEYSRDDEYSDR